MLFESGGSFTLELADPDVHPDCTADERRLEVSLTHFIAALRRSVVDGADFVDGLRAG
jgi:hypothetical protein